MAQKIIPVPKKKRRGPGRPFFKGDARQNPGGRPKAIVEVVQLAQQQTVLAVNTLISVARTSQTDAARVAAAVALLDRGWGKPTQRQEIAVSADLAKAVERLRSVRSVVTIDGECDG